MDVILAAGGMPKPDDALYPYTKGRPKALLKINGKPMVQWVLDALGGSTAVDRIFLSGLENDSILSCQKPLVTLPDQGSMVANIRAAARRIQEMDPAVEQVLLILADTPTITTEIIDWLAPFTREANHDLIMFLVKQQLTEARFPGADRRAYAYSDGEMSMANVFIMKINTILGHDELAERVAKAYHNIWRIIAFIGFGTVIAVRLGLYDSQRFALHMSKKLNIDGRIVQCPYPEVVMDVDKPHHVDIVRHDLENQLRNPVF